MRKTRTRAVLLLPVLAFGALAVVTTVLLGPAPAAASPRDGQMGSSY